MLPTFAEGLPVVLMESMALHRPVLTTYVAGIPELVRDGENGWLFPAGSVDRLAHVMLRCLQAPVEEFQRMGDAGHARFVQRHCSEAEAGKLAELFRFNCVNTGVVRTELPDERATVSLPALIDPGNFDEIVK